MGAGVQGRYLSKHQGLYRFASLAPGDSQWRTGERDIDVYSGPTETRGHPAILSPLLYICPLSWGPQMA